MKKRYLVLQDGTVFEGYAFGADKCAVGELIFSTNVVGYIETLTDPCYFGQILVQTFPMMGNYGIIESDFIGEPALSGYVVREYCDYPSNFRCEYDLDTFLKNKNIPGIYGVDTREITTIIRDRGVMNAALCDEIPADLKSIADFKIVDAVKSTSASAVSVYAPKGEVKGGVAVLDLGSSKNIEVALMDKGYKVTVLPYDTKSEEILATGAKVLFITEGPGNPAEIAEVAQELGKLSGKMAIVGAGLGHQLMAMAHGAEIMKLHHGHHGGNQPSKVVGTQRTLITSQNFNYAVKAETLKDGTVTHKNMNDGVCEGIRYSDREFSYQFSPAQEQVVAILSELA